MNITSLATFFDVVTVRNEVYYCRCPSHDDHEPSLEICKGRNGNPLIYCRVGCDSRSILAAVGLSWGAVLGTESVFTINGSTQYYHSRSKPPDREHKPEKPPRRMFIQQAHYKEVRHHKYDLLGGGGAVKVIRQNESGCKVPAWYRCDDDEPTMCYKGLNGSLPLLYRQLKSADAKTVWLTEGEKDVDTLIDCGAVAAVCLPNGAGQRKWHEHYTKFFKNKTVIMLWDNDEAGTLFRDWQTAQLNKIGAAVKWVDIFAQWENAPPKADISDYSTHLRKRGERIELK